MHSSRSRIIVPMLLPRRIGEGLFMAMPTMATANAMHGRLQQAKTGLFQGDASLVLAHGKTGLAKALARRDGGAARQKTHRDSETAAWCDAWVTDSRKTAFFASAGAGTIDQAFLSILPKKHLTLRQYGLAGRILIVDEAHACDAYMGEELKTLIEMQARLGGSVIVLSATLTRHMREDLVLSFARGRGMHPREDKAIRAAVRSEAYPLLTRYTASGGVSEHAVVGAADLARSVAIARVESREAVVTAAIQAARSGASVAIICNAVDPAIQTFEALLASDADPARTHLFHARFAMGDRLAIERDVQAWFGRESAEEMRRGRILVATQVIEQSLDVDFDVMFSDLAPADLLVQRAGRLWRHARAARPVTAPVLYILAPDPAVLDRAKWLESTLGTASHVYQMPGVLWRTAQQLFDKGMLNTPDDLRALIETAYDPGIDDLPDILHAGHNESIGKDYGKRARGRRNTISPAGGYTELTAPAPDEDIGTRDGAPSVTIRLAQDRGGGLEPYFGDGEIRPLDWALSEVAVRADWLARFARKAPAPADLSFAIASVQTQWPEFEQTIPILVLDSNGIAAGEFVSQLLYRQDIGLTGYSEPLNGD